MAFLCLLFIFLLRVIDAFQWKSDPSNSWLQAYLVVMPTLGSGGSPKVVSFGDEVRLGRESHNDLVLDDQFVSTAHARIYLEGEEYWLEDLGSRNRTYVNGELVIAPQMLRQAAVITMGNAVVVFHTSRNSPVRKG